MTIKKILWCGPLFNDVALATKKAPNQAAAKWSRGFLKGLGGMGVEIVGLTHCPEQYWPYGRMFQGVKNLFLTDYRHQAVPYPNIPFCRDPYLAWQYVRKSKQIIEKEGVDALVCYNVMDAFHVKTLGLSKQMRVPCFPIILDGADPRKDNWKWVQEGIRDASGVIFLSDWMVKNYPGNLPVLHMDGGCSAWYGDEAKQKVERNLIVYSGGLDHWRGLDFLVEVIRHVTRPECRFVICGKCDREYIRRRMGNDTRVDVKGFVSDAELHDLCLRATLFLNTRDPANRDNILNFPSKIPNYLAYGKPVVSTWIDSLSEDYRKVLQVVDSNEVVAFAAEVTNVLSWSETRRKDHAAVVKEWFLRTRLWTVQAQRCLDWMGSVVKAKTE